LRGDGGGGGDRQMNSIPNMLCAKVEAVQQYLTITNHIVTPTSG
jgi:TRAP-type C4-dicarboxylate transport system substrate-binding protein